MAAPDPQAELATLRATVARLEAELRAVSGQPAWSHTLLETIPAQVTRLSRDGVIEYINRIGARYGGTNPVGRTAASFIPPAQHHVLREALARTAATHWPSIFEVVIEAPDGTREVYLSSVGPILEANQLVGFVMISSDVTQVRATEAALAESRAQLQLALDAANLGIWRWDKQTDAVQWDTRLEAMFGLPPGGGPRTVAEFLALVPEDQRAAMAAHVTRSLETGHYPDFELRLDLPSGPRWVVIRGGVIRGPDGAASGLQGAVLNVTERRVIDEALRQRQKLEAVGQLSAGVAHNFNNMLAVIQPALEIAQAAAQGVDAELLRGALTSASNAAQLVRDLMVFSSAQPTGTSRQESLADTVRRAVELCQRTFERRVQLEVGDLDAARFVRVESGPMEQAVMNVLLNARDAVADTGSRPAHISISSRRLSPEESRRRHPHGPGVCVELRVADTGCGMDAATRQRMLEPFFTTKPAGRGTGLGLSTAWATVRDHRGALECESQPGEGTVLTLLLPAEDSPVAPAAIDTPRPAAQRRATVLIIDDEALVRRATARLLEAEGYVVHAAASGDAGVQLAEETQVDVVLLDYSMPGLSAAETLAALRRERPGLPVVTLSGLGASLAGANAQLLKPVTRDALVATLESVLDRAQR
jgi:signal transduction histidine kinase